jgi:hypothetical protein
VVAAVKTSGVSDLVDHRTLILPPLGAPGIHAPDVRRQTGWTVRWGPVRAEDLPRYLTEGVHRNEAMRRVTYRWPERIDTALGSLFPFYLLGAVAFLLLWPRLFLDYLVIGAVTFLVFMPARGFRASADSPRSLCRRRFSEGASSSPSSGCPRACGRFDRI